MPPKNGTGGGIASPGRRAGGGSGSGWRSPWRARRSWCACPSRAGRTAQARFRRTPPPRARRSCRACPSPSGGTASPDRSPISENGCSGRWISPETAPDHGGDGGQRPVDAVTQPLEHLRPLRVVLRHHRWNVHAPIIRRRPAGQLRPHGQRARWPGHRPAAGSVRSRLTARTSTRETRPAVAAAAASTRA